VQLKAWGEFRLIDTIARLTASPAPGLIRGIGDDAAVFAAGGKACLLVTTDALTEGIHFRRESSRAFLLGKKSMSVNLSDIAAMGGKPLYYVVALTAPPDTPLAFIKEFYRGMDRQARRFGAFLAGGDTTASGGGITVAVTLIGSARRDRIVYRQGARQGDLLYVTGSLGDSALGLLMLEKKGIKKPSPFLVTRHLDPTPRVAAGRRIAALEAATSMIDISDGLAADLRHILSASGAGARVHLPALPLSRSYRKHCPDFSCDFYGPALRGGEDYELLFTVSPKKVPAIKKLSQQLRLPMTCIGDIAPKKAGLRILDHNGRTVALANEGYRHF